MKKTLNYNLKKPEGNEYAKIEDLNENADIIDNELKNLDNKINNFKIPEVPVKSVNSKTGKIELKAEDIKTNDGSTVENILNTKAEKSDMSKSHLQSVLGLSSLAYRSYLSWNEIESRPVIPTKTSDLKDDSNFIKSSSLVDNTNEDSKHRAPSCFALKEVKDSKVDKVNGKKLSSNDFTDEYKNKLERLKINSDGTASTVQYVHPSTHPASMITTDSYHRFVTDNQISKWDSNQGKVKSVNGFDGSVFLDARSIPYKNNLNIYQGLDYLDSKLNKIGSLDIDNSDFKSSTLNGVLSELFQFANNHKSMVADIIGEPVTTTDDMKTIYSKVEKKRVRWAENLVAYDIPGLCGSEGLASTIDTLFEVIASRFKEKELIQKYSTKYATGQIEPTYPVGLFTQRATVSNLSFKPLMLAICTCDNKEPHGMSFYCKIFEPYLPDVEKNLFYIFDDNEIFHSEFTQHITINSDGFIFEPRLANQNFSISFYNRKFKYLAIGV